jgi:hypothetical protein
MNNIDVTDLNVWLALLFHIWEGAGSSLGPETGYLVERRKTTDVALVYLHLKSNFSFQIVPYNLLLVAMLF